MVKLIISVIASAEHEIYRVFIKEYWVPYIIYLNNMDIKVFLLFSNEEKNKSTIDYLQKTEIKDNICIYDVIEDGPVGQPGCLQKTILNFKEILEKETFDFVLRTNLSTVFLPDRLLQFVNSYNPSEKILLGGIHEHKTWGGCYILSKPLLIDFVKHSDKINLIDLNDPDDIVSNNILRKYCSPYIIIKNYAFKIIRYGKGSKKIWDSQIKDLYNNIIKNTGIMHIRLKNTKNRNFDLEFLKYFIKNYLL